MKNIILYDDYDFGYTEEEWKEIAKDLDLEYEYNSNAYYDYLNDELNCMGENLIYDLNYIQKPNTEYIAIADLGLWNGRRMGYKELSNLTDILGNYDYTKVYTDNYNLKVDGIHHDGTNYIIIRKFKDISDVQKENFLDKIYNGKVTPQDISRYTKSLLEDIDF